MSPLETLLERLQSASPDLTPDEIRDALWLAPYLPRSEYLASAQDSTAQQPPDPAIEKSTTTTSKTSQPFTPPKPTSPPSAFGKRASPLSDIPLYTRAQAASSSDEVEGRWVVPASRVRVPKAKALPNARALARSLRPLMRRTPSHTEQILDEEKTAERLAEQFFDRRVPRSLIAAMVLRPAAERWLDVAFVVDTSNSMIIWMDTAREFRDLLAGQGAFSDVRMWQINTQCRGTPALTLGTLPPEKTLTPAALATTQPSARLRKRFPQELVRPQGNRLILVLSDCVGPGWQDGTMSQLLAQWGAVNCVGVLQILPGTLWHRTVMNPGDLLVHAHAAGLPNYRLTAEMSRDVPFYVTAELLAQREKQRAIPIPLVAFNARMLGEYARMVAGLGRVRVPAVDVKAPAKPAAASSIPTAAAISTPASADTSISESRREGDPLTAVARFQAAADPVTQKLAGYLSLLPLNLSIIRMAQGVLLPAAQLTHLAEFLTSGLVYRDLKAESDAGEPVFDFIRAKDQTATVTEGIREILQRTVRRSDTLRVFRKIAEFLREESGLGEGLAALAPNELGIETLTLNARTLPFARLQADVLARMGMRAAAQTLRERIGAHKPRAITLLTETNPRPDVFFRPAWSPDGRQFAAPTRDGRVVIYDGGNLAAPIQTLEESKFGMNQVTWSPDGKYLAAASFDRTAFVWELPNQTPTRRLRDHHSDVRSISFTGGTRTPDIRTGAETLSHTKIATGTRGGTLRIWSLQSRRYSFSNGLGRGSINVIAGSPDGTLLAFGCDDGTIGIHSESLGQPLLHRELHASVRSLCWAEQRSLYVGTSAGEITRWTLSDDKFRLEQNIVAHRGVINSLSLSSDGRVLVSKSTDHSVRFWRADTLTYLDGFDEQSSGYTYSSAIFHPSRPILATTAADDHALRFWEVDLEALLASRATGSVEDRWMKPEPITATLLERKQTHFVLWALPPSAPPPVLVIGQLMPDSSPTLMNERRFPLRLSPAAGGLWELAADACALSEGEVYHYWYEVDRRSPERGPARGIFCADPTAWSVNWNLQAPTAANEKATDEAPPASVVKYSKNRLEPCDPGGEAPDWTGDVTPEALPPNNRLVIYRLPTCWTHSKGNRTSVGLASFRDMALLIEGSITDIVGTGSHTDPNSSGSANRRSYLQDLGVNALELPPPADTWLDRIHGSDYTTTNPFAPDPEFGSQFEHGHSRPVTDLAHLIKTCHQHGMRFMLDIALSAAFRNPYCFLNFESFFVLPRPNVDQPDGERRQGFGGDLYRYQDLLASGYDPLSGRSDRLSPARQYMKLCVNHWINYYHVDGLRLDNMRNVGNWDFIEELKNYAHEVSRGRGWIPDRFMVIGEDLSVPLGMLAQNRLDSIENDHFRQMVRLAILGRTVPSEPDFAQMIRKLIDCRLLGFVDGTQAVNYVTARFLHGFANERLRSWLTHNEVTNKESRIKLAFACLLTAVGVPMILAGEEFGDQEDFVERKPVTVNFGRLADPGATQLVEYVSRLIHLRTTSNALAIDDTEFIHTDFDQGKRVIAWKRGRGTELVIVVANFSDWGTRDPVRSNAQYVIQNWPNEPAGYTWHDVPNARRVSADAAKREPIAPWQAKVYALIQGPPDQTTAIELPNLPAERAAKALISRAISKRQRGDSEGAIADYTAAIELPNAPAGQVAKALVNRGITKRRRGDSEGSIADYTAAIELPNVPAEQVAQALNSRAITKRRRGHSEGAIADYTAAIELPNAPAGQVAKALNNRGIIKGQRGDSAGAIADYTAAIELPNAPAEMVEVLRKNLADAVALAAGNLKIRPEKS